MNDQILQDFQKLANSSKAKLLSGFFKTGKGQYGEGDIFLGIVVPEQRKLAKKYKDLSIKDIQSLLTSKIHEYRLTALFILTEQYEKAKKENNKTLQTTIFNLYLNNTKNINNWDLVDLSAPKIVGDYLLKRNRKVLYKLAKGHLWEKRISILATFAFVVKGEYKDTLNIAKLLLNDKHDLIHKAVGWMLREVGKRVGEDKEEIFLKKYYKVMPRTMLRYAIERFSPKKKKFYMN